MSRLSREDYIAERNRRVEQLTEAMSQRVTAIATGEEAQAAIAFAARFRSRSPRNAMLIYMQWEERNRQSEQEIPEPTLIAGYKAFQEMGRQVRRGEKGYEILAPVTARFASMTPDIAGSWRRLAPREKAAPGERVESRMVGAKPATVFDISQTDGPDFPRLPAWKPLAEGVVPEGLHAAVIAEIQREGFRVEALPGTGFIGSEGMTSFSDRVVTYNGGQGEAEQIATLLHELGHVKMHDPDEDRVVSRGQKEFEAETFAHVVAAMHGLDTSASSDAYATSWTLSHAGGDPERAAEMNVAATQVIARAVNETIGRMPIGGEISDGSPKQSETPTPPRTTAGETRLRNALRMEAQAVARIREEPPVPDGPRLVNRPSQ